MSRFSGRGQEIDIGSRGPGAYCCLPIGHGALGLSSRGSLRDVSLSMGGKIHTLGLPILLEVPHE